MRTALSEDVWREKSIQIQRNILSHPLYAEADAIYCYLDFRKEAGTKELIEDAWLRGKKVAVPKVEGNIINFYYIDSFRDVAPGAYGILEPEGKKEANDEQVLLIMPGAAFDKERNRVGYGGGFYDRYIEQHPQYRRIAAAFSFQMVEKIPAMAFDRKPEVIVTETEIYEETKKRGCIC